MLFVRLFLHFGGLFFGPFQLASQGMIVKGYTHDLEEFPLEWLEIPVLMEQQTMRLIFRQNGRHTRMLIESDLKRSPILGDLFPS